MADGERDSFVENDVLGNSNSGVVSLLRGSSSRRTKRRKKHSRKTSHRRKSRIRRKKIRWSNTDGVKSTMPKFGSKAWFKKYKPHSHRRKHRRKKKR